MLILTRRPVESIHIGDDVTVTVLAVKGNSVQLGFDAPTDVEIHREEIWIQIYGEEGEPAVQR